MNEGPIKNKENKEQQYGIKLKAILDRKITVENIDYFIDLSVEDLIKLTDEIVKIYKAEHPQDQSIGKELEDKAYKHNKLPDIAQFLDTAQEKLEQLGEIDSYIKSNIKTISMVVVPPNKGEKIIQGEKKYEAPDIKHRLKSLLYLLKQKGISFDDINIIDGVLDEKIMRGKSYVSITIPELDRLALICDEEGNASYIFDLDKLKEKKISTQGIINMEKNKLNELIKNNSGIGLKFTYSVNWIDRTEDFLFNKLPDNSLKDLGANNSNIKNLPKVSSIELDPWKNFWIDPKTGKHWGTPHALTAKLGLDQTTIRRLSVRGKWAFVEVWSNTRPGKAYCYEDSVNDESVKKFIESPYVEKSGEWEGFYADKEGKHYGLIKALVRKIGINRDIINRIIETENFTSIKVINLAKHVNDAYSYEELLKSTKIKKFLEAFSPKKDGEWKGFYINDNENHFGTMNVLIKKLKSDVRTIQKCIDNGKLQSIKIRTKAGDVYDSFCYEEIADILNNKEIIKRRKDLT